MPIAAGTSPPDLSLPNALKKYAHACSSTRVALSIRFSAKAIQSCPAIDSFEPAENTRTTKTNRCSLMCWCRHFKNAPDLPYTFGTWPPQRTIDHSVGLPRSGPSWSDRRVAFRGFLIHWVLPFHQLLPLNS